MEELITMFLKKEQKKKEIIKAIKEIIFSNDFKNLFFPNEKIEDVLKSADILDVLTVNFVTNVNVNQLKLAKDIKDYLHKKIKQKYPDYPVNWAVSLKGPIKKPEEEKTSYYIT